MAKQGDMCADFEDSLCAQRCNFLACDLVMCFMIFCGLARLRCFMISCCVLAYEERRLYSAHTGHRDVVCNALGDWFKTLEAQFLSCKWVLVITCRDAWFEIRFHCRSTAIGVQLAGTLPTDVRGGTEPEQHITSCVDAALPVHVHPLQTRRRHGRVLRR